MLLREEYTNRQHDREIPTVTMQEFLNIQAAIRAAQNGGTVVSAGSLLPNNMPLLIAALPSIVYVPPVQRAIKGTGSGLGYSQVASGGSGGLISGSVSGFILGSPSSLGSNRVVPTEERESDDIESGGVGGVGGGEERDSQAPLCMVCLGCFVAGDILTRLPCACAHQYHRLCLIAWLERKTTCPLCTESVAAMLLGPVQPEAGSGVRSGSRLGSGSGVDVWTGSRVGSGGQLGSGPLESGTESSRNNDNSIGIGGINLAVGKLRVNNSNTDNIGNNGNNVNSAISNVDSGHNQNGRNIRSCN